MIYDTVREFYLQIGKELDKAVADNEGNSDIENHENNDLYCDVCKLDYELVFIAGETVFACPNCHKT